MPNRVSNATIVITNVTVLLTAISVISVAGWLPLPIGIACLSFIACFVRPQWKAGLWMWIAAAALTTIGAMTTPDTSPMELLQIGPARPRNLLMQASLAGTFVNALAYRQQDPRRSALLVMIGVIVTATGITNTFSFPGRAAAAILPLIAGLLLSINNISIKPTLKTLRWQLVGTLCFLLAFAGSTTLISSKKDLLYELGNRMLDTRSLSASGSRGIEQPQLGPTYGDAGSTARILHLNSKKPLYLRQAAYSSYLSGTWGPPLTFRRMAPLPSKYILGPDPNAITILRYDATDRIVYIPAETTGIVADADSNLAWAQDDSGPVITGPDAAAEYAVSLGTANSATSAETLLGLDSVTQQEASLEVPDDLSGPLERFVARNGIEDGYTLDTAQAVVAALQREHEYSLRFSPNPGDALASFLDSPGDGAHCAYFASATVMLLRHLGYPARLVSGFFAHEPAGNGITVRGRDAHAWAEVHVPRKGWVLVEATPAAGLPSGDESSVGWFGRLWEKITDTARRIRTELENGNVTFIAVPSIFVALILAWSYFAKRRRLPTTGVIDPYFTDFVRIYNRICTKSGIPNVGNETLMHHFSTHASTFDDVTRTDLRRCVDNYERCRYGKATKDTDGIANLRGIYQRLRKH
jgi:transglutaminase-like putative cysteine protease